MTCRRELEELQLKARRAGRICNFYIGPTGVEAVFYEGRIYDPLTFAEKERVKPEWWRQVHLTYKVPQDVPRSMGPMSRNWISEVMLHLKDYDVLRHARVGLMCRCNSCYCCMCLLISRQQWSKLTEYYQNI